MVDAKKLTLIGICLGFCSGALSLACTKEYRSDMPRENPYGAAVKEGTPDPEVKPMDEATLPPAPAETVEEGPRPNPQYHIRVSNISNQPLEFVMQRVVSHDIADWYQARNAQLVAEGPDFKTFVVPGIAFKLPARSSILIRAYNGPVTFDWVIKLDKDQKKWLRGVKSANVPQDSGVEIPNNIKDQI